MAGSRRKSSVAKKAPTINKGLVKALQNFSVSKFKLSPDERAKLEQVHFSEEQAKKVHYKLGGPIDFS